MSECGGFPAKGQQVFCGDAALVLQHGESFKKFIVRCCHFSGSSCNLLSIYVSQTPYEYQARENLRGLWQGQFYKPWDWRVMQTKKPKIKITRPKKAKKNLLD